MLAHKEEFIKLLADYKPHSDVMSLLSRVKLVLLTAPSGIGRNTIINRLVETNHYHHIISDTTRAPRENNGVMETNGHPYWFKTEEEFLEGLKAGDYIEAALIHNQQVSGINHKELLKAEADNRIALTDVEFQGVNRIKKLKPDTLIFFTLPPSFEEWHRRIVHRGEMPKDELIRRFQSAQKEIADAIDTRSYILIVNDNLDLATSKIDSIVLGDVKVDYSEQKQLRDFLLSLKVEVEKFTNSLLST